MAQEWQMDPDRRGTRWIAGVVLVVLLVLLVVLLATATPQY